MNNQPRLAMTLDAERARCCGSQSYLLNVFKFILLPQLLFPWTSLSHLTVTRRVPRQHPFVLIPHTLACCHLLFCFFSPNAAFFQISKICINKKSEALNSSMWQISKFKFKAVAVEVVLNSQYIHRTCVFTCSTEPVDGNKQRFITRLLTITLSTITCQASKRSQCQPKENLFSLQISSRSENTSSCLTNKPTWLNRFPLLSVRKR